jgi:signal transduction histidine kinase
MGQSIRALVSGRRPRMLVSTAAFAATVLVGVLVERSAYPHDPAAAVRDLAVAVAFVVGGAVVWSSVPSSGLSGPLMVATGAAWLAGGLSPALVFWHRGPLVQLIVAAPDGRARTWLERLVVAVGYVDAVVAGVARARGPTIALAVIVGGVALARCMRLRGVQRRAGVVSVVASVAVAFIWLIGAVTAPAGGGTVLFAYQAILVAIVAACVADLRRGGWARAALADVVIDLGELPQGGSLNAALARATVDPSLVVAYLLTDGRYVDETGQAVVLPAAGSARRITTVETDGAPAAVLVHHPATLRARGLADGVIAAVRLTLENARLHAEIRAHMHEVRASRGRLLEARDVERRRLEERLRAGVDRRLDAAACALADVARDPDELISSLAPGLDDARAELRRFAAGLHPRGLERGGLSSALPELAMGAAFPVDVVVGCDRLDPQVELAAWFICSEALANVVKHARADRATIRAQCVNGWLVVLVEDDGRGGAKPSAGQGIRGIAARADAVGGSLTVCDRPEGGTRLEATFPARERA